MSRLELGNATPQELSALVNQEVSQCMRLPSDSGVSLSLPTKKILSLASSASDWNMRTRGTPEPAARGQDAEESVPICQEV
jgi:hypothetical protein